LGKIFKSNTIQDIIIDEHINVIMGRAGNPTISVGGGGNLSTYYVRKYKRKEIARFEFASHKTKVLAGLINYIIFRHSLWSGRQQGQNIATELQALQKKIKRNSSHIEKNELSILLVKDVGGQIVGFTHVVAINQECWEAYIDGRIGDVDFSSDNIVAKNEEAYAILLFSIGYLETAMLRNFIKEIGPDCASEVIQAMSMLQRKKPKTKDVNLAHIIMKATTYHINELVKAHFSNSASLRILVQVEEDRFEKILKRKTFYALDKLSLDSCTLLKTQMRIDRSQLL
jgi:hypothetical protein